LHARTAGVALGPSGGYSRSRSKEIAGGTTAMSVDTDTVKKVARLARIALSDDDAERMKGELNAILGFVEQLNEVDVSGVEPMTSVTPMEMKKRQDIVTDGGKAGDIVANAPTSQDNFFLVPKVVE
jgi:aspartyl-tRNA(Asn)/glutamyl-tRNA(Gln) amidotransferase subunit C